METNEKFRLLIIASRQDLATLCAGLPAAPRVRLLKAANGPAGIELAASEDPDMILLDLSEESAGLCRTLKASDHLGDIPVVFLSAPAPESQPGNGNGANTASRSEALEAGAAAFLNLPLETVELAALIRTMAGVKTASRSLRKKKAHTQDFTEQMNQGENTDAPHIYFENMQDAFFRADLSGRLFAASPSAESMYGYSLGEITGLPAASLYADPGEREKLINTLRETGSMHDWIGKGLRKDGTEFRVSMNVRFLHDETGQVTGTEGVVRDISEHKQAEEHSLKVSSMLQSLNAFMLEQSEVHNYGELVETIVSQLDQLLSPSVIIFNEFDRQARILRIKNIKASRGILDLVMKIAGKKILSTETRVTDDMYAEIVSDRLAVRHNLHVISGGAIPLAVSDRLEKALKIGSCLVLSYIVDGEVYGTTLAILREEPDPVITGFLKHYAHFTSNSLMSVLLAQELRERDQVQRTLLEKMPIGVIVIDAATREIELVNDTALALLGQGQSSSLIGHPCNSHVNFCTASGDSCPILDEDLDLENSESVMIHADGSLLPVLKSVLRIMLNGQEKLIECFADLSGIKQAEEEQKRLQEQLLQAQKMESIGRLAGGVAHDFNNMLSVITGYGEMILDSLPADDPLLEDIEQIMRASQRSAALTGQLLAFSRRQTLQRRVLDVNELIHNLEDMVRRLIGEDIELELELSRDIGCTLADPGQIEQVIMNLVVNARDAMPEGGKLLIETAAAELDEAYAAEHPEVTAGDYVLIAVTDTGIGIDRENLSQIFEPFFTTKEKGQGTGLGLSMVYGIVKQSGGHINVYSEPRFGTIFRIYLPRTDTIEELSTSGRRAARAAGGGEHILVVEDEESLRSLIARFLSGLGYEISLAVDGRAALVLVEEESVIPDLIITDMIMPHLNGRELIERLREQHPNIKALYMSGYTDHAIIHNYMLEPGQKFLQKPFKFNTAAATIRSILDSGN